MIKNYDLLCKMFDADPEKTKDGLEPILRKKFMDTSVKTQKQF